MKGARLIFHVGGPAFHPTLEQARVIQGWLGPDFDCATYDGVDAFMHLDDCDLLVIMGLHWTGMSADRSGNLVYRPMTLAHQHALEMYVASGRPVLCHHGSIASYDDWPRFGELIGFAWIWGVTSHSELGDHQVRILPTGHPVVAGVSNYTIHDELYHDVRIAPGMQVAVHAEATWQGRMLPMVFTGESGRTPGAGRTVYLANGHDMQAFACPAMKQLWNNAVRWLLRAA